MTDDEQYVVLEGNLSDGFRVVGPFADIEEAMEWCYLASDDTWAMTLEAPTRW